MKYFFVCGNLEDFPFVLVAMHTIVVVWDNWVKRKIFNIKIKLVKHSCRMFVLRWLEKIWRIGLEWNMDDTEKVEIWLHSFIWLSAKWKLGLKCDGTALTKGLNLLGPGTRTGVTRTYHMYWDKLLEKAMMLKAISDPSTIYSGLVIWDLLLVSSKEFLSRFLAPSEGTGFKVTPNSFLRQWI